MTRWVLVLALLAASAGWADVPRPPLRPDLSCVGRPVGAACGQGGRCAKRVVRRPDFSAGGVPTWGDVEVLVCEGASAGGPFERLGWAWAALWACLAGGWWLMQTRRPAVPG
jgi:hypothetical protein